MKTRVLMMVLATVGWMLISGGSSQADLAIKGFDSTGQLAFNTLNDGTNYNYQIEWAPSPAGPWSPFTGVGAWLDNVSSAGSRVTNPVPMCYRVVATLGDYMVVDISGGTNASSYPVSYYRSLADLPGGTGVNIDTYKTTNMVFRRIPAGTYTMGSPAEELGRSPVETQHTVTLMHPFYCGVFEVTQKQWERVMGTWPSYFTNASYRNTRPVEQVTYGMIRGTNTGALWPATNSVDASSFMGRLRARTGKAFDLPTESQWEYAGRSGTTTALNSGKNLTSTLNCPNMAEVGRYWYDGGTGGLFNPSGDSSVGTAKVGSYLPSPWGLYDIHGNVWEWCLDWYGAYPNNSVSDPPGLSSGSGRVCRGGSWSPNADYCRVGMRTSYDPNNVYNALGFRVVLPSGQ